MAASAPVLFACVAENRRSFATMAHNLAISIRSFGGALSGAPIVVNFVEAADEAFTRPLVELGVEVRVVERVSEANPPVNKLRMLRLRRDYRFDVLIALDCDTAVVGDPSPWIDTESIGVKSADLAGFNDLEWSTMFAEVKIPVPDKTLTATITGKKTYPYFNSGVLFVPGALCEAFGEAWMRRYAELATMIRRNPGAIRKRRQFFLDQAALALTLIGDGLPWRELPPALNFPTHVAVPRDLLDGPPVVLHYHGEWAEDGFLLSSATSSVNSALDAFNRRRADVTHQTYIGLGPRSTQQRLPRSAKRRLGNLVADRAWYRSVWAARIRDVLRQLLTARSSAR